MPRKALAINCALKDNENKSSTDKLLREVCAEQKKREVKSEVLPATDYDIKPGVTKDEGGGDEWPSF